MADKPVTGLTVWGALTSGTTTQLDANFAALQAAVNDFNTYDNYLPDVGGANAYVVTLPANITGVLTVGLLVQFKASAANTGAATLNYNGGGALNIKRIDGSTLAAGDIPANGIVAVQYDGTQWLLQTPYSSSNVQAVPVRQTVLSGPIDTSGFPTIIPASCTSLTLNTSNMTASAPLIVASSNGFGATGAMDRMGYTTGNLSWANLTANSVNYLGVVVAANGNMTTAFTTVAPVYQWGGAATTGNGNYTFNIQAMQMQVGNGSAAAQTFTVLIGEANCNSNAVISATNYAYMARYDSGFTATLPGTSSKTVKTHNLGIRPEFVDFVIENTTAEAGYAIGDRVHATSLTTSDGTTVAAPTLMSNANSSSLTTANTTAFGTVNISSGARVGLTAADWKYKFTASRGW